MKIVKRIIIALILVVFLAFGAVVTLIYLNQDDIEQRIISELNLQLKSEILIEDVTISAIKSFPFVSISLDNLTIFDAFQTDTLCQLDQLSVNFNALDLYHQNYIIQNLRLKNGKITVFFEDSIANYEIWYSDTTTSQNSNLDLGLESIILENVQIEYRNRDMLSLITSHKSEIELDISGENINLDLKGQFTNNAFVFDNTNFLSNQPIDLDAEISIDSMALSLKSNALLAQLPLDITLSNNKQSTQVSVTTPKTDLTTILGLVPKKYLRDIQPYDISGNTQLNVFILSDQLPMPKINVDFTYNNGIVKSNDFPIEINNINLTGSYTNSNRRNNGSTKILLNDINCLINDETIVGRASIVDIDNPKINTTINTQLQLSDLDSYGYKIPFDSLSGKAEIDLTYNGHIGLKNKIDYDLAMADKSATIKVENMTLQIDSASPSLSKTNLQLKVTNDQFDIQRLDGYLQDNNDFQFLGALDNVFSHFLLKNAPLKVAGNLTSNSINVDDFVLEVDTNTQSQEQTKMEAIRFPEDIIANINFTLQDFIYDRIHLRNLASSISYKDKTLRAKGIELETMSGKITSDIRLKQLRSGKLRLISTTGLDNINVRQLFYEFRNFGQETMRHKHLKGSITSEIYLRNEWDKFFNPIDGHLYSFIDVTISNGELLEFEPMMLMSDYISVEELKRIKFSTLENQIEIKNNIVDIPFMEINSSATDIACAGTYSFDGKMDFDIKVLLNEILGNKFRRKNKKKVSEFEIIEESNSKGMALFLKMEGTTDDPIVSPNTFKLKESLNKEFKNEKRKLKDIIKNEFDNNEDSQPIDNPDYNKIIEWEE